MNLEKATNDREVKRPLRREDLGSARTHVGQGIELARNEADQESDV
jgi:hypothetical protein